MYQRLHSSRAIQQRVTHNKLFKVIKLTQTARLVLRAIIDYYSWEKQYAKVAQGTIADGIGSKRTYVVEAIKELEKAGLLISAKETGLKSCYKLTNLFFSIVTPELLEENTCQNFRQEGVRNSGQEVSEIRTQSIYNSSNFSRKNYNELEILKEQERIRRERSQKLLQKIELEKQNSRGIEDFTKEEAIEYLSTIPEFLENSTSIQYLRKKYKIFKQA